MNEKGKDDYAAFVKDWVFRKLEAELGFSPQKEFDSWAQPHLHQLELMSFVIEYQIDWVTVGHEFRKNLASRISSKSIQ